MEVFLFPLVNVSLFPKTTKPLNIFEPRYLEMVRRSIETGTPIAIGFIEDPTLVGPVKPGDKVSFVREVAGYGLAQIVEERTNGTLLIFLQGQGKIKLQEVVDSGEGFIVCRAQLLPELVKVKTEMNKYLSSLQKILVRWINTHIPDPSQREIFMRNLSGPEEVVGAFAAYLVRDYDLQQMILEFNDINDKIEFLHRLVESNEITT